MFGKIFEQIYDSSIAEDWTVRMVFQDFIVLADINGVVNRTHEAIARRTNVPIEVVLKAISVLESPDLKSQSPVADGRRIVRLDEHRDWGWQIVNYKAYRDIASDEQRREKTLARVRKFRKDNSLGPCNDDVTLCNAGNAMQRQRQREKQKNKKEEGPRSGCVSAPDLQTLLNQRFSRLDGQRWTCEEERCLCEVARRHESRQEFDTIFKFKDGLPEADRKYFPNSVLSLLTKWSDTLDRARATQQTKSFPPLDPEKYSVTMINGKRVVKDKIRGHVIEGM